MFNCSVELYGIPQQITKQNRVEIELKDNASLKDVIVALKHQIPALEGPVFQEEQDRLIENYAFIVNGQFQLSESNVPVQRNDRVVLVLLATGG